MAIERDQGIIELRKRGFKYKEIMAELGVRYHTVQNVLTVAGLTETHYKYEREDVIRKTELDEIFTKASDVEYLGLPGEAWQALIAIMWLFGKRISEIVCLKASEVDIEEGDLIIRFMVLKKKGRQNSVKRPFTKRVTLENEYTAYVVRWWNKISDRTDFLFPRPQTKMGHIYRQYAHDVMKMISNLISSHLFRHSLATQMAERGATAYELVNWFDWDRMDTALEYIKRSGRMTEKLSKRKW